jgi:hypothetical protein
MLHGYLPAVLNSNSRDSDKRICVFFNRVRVASLHQLHDVDLGKNGWRIFTFFRGSSESQILGTEVDIIIGSI